MSEPRIVDELKRIVNTKDGDRNTPLHYATQLWPQEVVKLVFMFYMCVFGYCRIAKASIICIYNLYRFAKFLSWERT